MLKMLTTGAQYFCDLCQEPVVRLDDARGLFAPLNGAHTAQAVVIVHQACRRSRLAAELFPGYSARSLSELLAQADEACNRGSP